MAAMSAVEAAFCRSAPWRATAGRVVMPWALGGVAVEGDALEVGGGAGAMAAALLRRHPGLRLTVTDIDPAMTAPAGKRLARFGDRARVHVADVVDLPYPDGAFDLVACFLMLHHVVAWEASLGEIHRVLRPGGRFVGCDLVEAPVAAAVHRIDAGRRRHYAAEDLRTGAVAAGFDEVEVRPGLLRQLVRFDARRPPEG